VLTAGAVKKNKTRIINTAELKVIRWFNHLIPLAAKTNMINAGTNITENNESIT
jgi:hypothetical protein